MGLINVIAVIIAIAAVLAAVGYVGYLALLHNAATKRAGGGQIAEYVRSRWSVAGGATVAALLAWLLTSGGVVLDVLAILVAAGSGSVAVKALQSTQTKYRGLGK